MNMKDSFIRSFTYSFITFLALTLGSVLDSKSTIANHTAIPPFIPQMLIERLLRVGQNNSFIHSRSISWKPFLCLPCPRCWRSSDEQDRCGPCPWRTLQSHLCGRGLRELGVQRREIILIDGTDRLQGPPEGPMWRGR